MIRRANPVLLLSILLACTNDNPSAVQTPNQWGDERLWPVLEAQEHRDTEALCALLKDSAVEVRSAAALAFASVQDSSASSCLLMALTDSSNVVRSNSAYALGFIADSLTLEAMAAHALVERDSAVQRSLMSASFLAVLRGARITDAQPLLHMLDKGKAQDRARAADALRRLAPLTLRSFGQEYLKMTQEERDPEVKAVLIRGLGSLEGDAHIAPLTDWALQGPTPSIRISAIRSLGRSFVHGRPVAFYSLLADPEPMVRSAMLEQLNGFGDHLVADSLLTILPRLDRKDTLVRCQVLRLLVSTPRGERLALDSLRADRPKGPYAKAEWLQAIAHDELTFPDDSLRSIMLGKDHAAVRQAAFTVLSQREQQRMLMPRAITRDLQVREAVPFYRAVFESGDAGLISAIAELLRTTDKDVLAVLFPKDVEAKAMASLEPIRDLEAILLLRELSTRRDGLKPASNVPIAFNHGINRSRLLALKQGQRYRIITAKGEVVIATDVDQCPGSSLAFDSLVTAGYYNGKAFHRVVPDFVVQGGCPRGDGYGGMPWTLRTEIGRTPFTAGSVGLASAGRDTESCQFFITHSAAPHLDGRYTRFGEVVSGMDVVWKLQVGDVMERVERID